MLFEGILFGVFGIVFFFLFVIYVGCFFRYLLGVSIVINIKRDLVIICFFDLGGYVGGKRFVFFLRIG